MSKLDQYITHVQIDSSQGKEEFKLSGPISTAVTKLRKNSPFPGWFWSRLYKTHKARYTRGKDFYEFTLTQHTLKELANSVKTVENGVTSRNI